MASTDDTTRSSESPQPVGADKWRVFIPIGLSFVTLVLSSSMVFVLLNAIAEDYGVTLRAVGWVVIVESLLVGALLLPLGGVADTIGRRRVYLVGLSVFGVGSLLTGLAPSFAALIAARLVMALGAALVQAVSTGMLVAAFPPDERGKALGAQTTAVSCGAAAGPLLAGIAVRVIDWSTLFLLLSIPVAISIAAALVVLPDDRPPPGRPRRSFDPLGGLLSALAVVAVVVTISNPFAVGWSSPTIIGGAVLAVGSLAAFVWWELHTTSPVLELRLFAGSTFRSAVSVRFLGFLVSTPISLLLPVYLVSYRGFAESIAGAVLFVLAVGMGLSAQISGNLSDRVGPRGPSLVGLSIQLLLALVLFAFAESLPVGVVGVLAFVTGLSIGLWNVPNNAAMMGSVPVDNYAVIGAFTNVTRTLGSVVGQALAAGIVVSVMAGQGFDIPLGELADTPAAAGSFLDGWRAAYATMAVVSIVALLVAFRLPNRPLAPVAERVGGRPPTEAAAPPEEGDR